MSADNPPPLAVSAAEVPDRPSSTGMPAPFADVARGRSKKQLGNPFGLTNFGVNLTRLSPGAQSSLMHRHQVQDEFIFILEGTATLATDRGEVEMKTGMCAGFAKGGVAHHLVNRSNADVLYLEVGDRTSGDIGEYPGVDLRAVLNSDATWRFEHKDGTPYQDTANYRSPSVPELPRLQNPGPAAPFQIVTASPAHRDAMVEIVRAGTAEFGITFDPTSFDNHVLSFGDGTASKVVELALIDSNGRLRGGISAIHESATTACIKGFYIDPDFRGLKAGHALLSATLAKCAEMAAERVELTTWQKMEAAVALYERFGFELTARLAPTEGCDSLYTLLLKDRSTSQVQGQSSGALANAEGAS